MAGRIPLHMRRGRKKQMPGVPKHAAVQRDLRDPVESALSDLAMLKARTKRLKGAAAKKAKKDIKKAEARIKAARKGSKPAFVSPPVVDDSAAKAQAKADKAAAKAAKKAAEAEAEAAIAAAEAVEEAADAQATADAQAEADAIAAADAAEAEAKAKDEAAADEKPAMPEVDMGNNRDELDAAALSVGVVEPEKMGKKQDVFDAIVAATK
jgi:hypothetical protein